MIFTGTYAHTIDSKHRLAIPAVFRAQLKPERDGNVLYVMPGSNGAIWLWTEREFEKLASGFDQSLLPDQDMMAIDEAIFPLTHRVELDSAGRIRLPEEMLDGAGISGSVAVVGVRDHIELHEPTQWAAAAEVRRQRMKEAMERRGQRGASTTRPADRTADK